MDTSASVPFELTQHLPWCHTNSGTQSLYRQTGQAECRTAQIIQPIPQDLEPSVTYLCYLSTVHHQDPIVICHGLQSVGDRYQLNE